MHTESEYWKWGAIAGTALGWILGEKKTSSLVVGAFIGALAGIAIYRV